MALVMEKVRGSSGSPTDGKRNTDDEQFDQFVHIRRHQIMGAVDDFRKEYQTMSEEELKGIISSNNAMALAKSVAREELNRRALRKEFQSLSSAELREKLSLNAMNIAAEIAKEELARRGEIIKAESIERTHEEVLRMNETRVSQYKNLRRVAKLCKGLAITDIVVGALVVLVSFMGAMFQQLPMVLVAIVAVAAFIVFSVAYVFLMALAEGIVAVADMADNSYEIKHLLEIRRIGSDTK